ncbi:MAG: archease [Candidatus Solibacter usitatus]|nr:archease [Candidatus Solibacter usitatus]
MPGYEILAHTADTGFRAHADTLEELFIQAAHALVEVALDPSGAVAFEPREVTATGSDEGELLVNWLNEVLFLLDGRRWVPARFEAVSIEEGGVVGRVLGEARDDTRHRPRIVVKAATFHQLRIGEQNGVWEAEVYLDI